MSPLPSKPTLSFTPSFNNTESPAKHKLNVAMAGLDESGINDRQFCGINHSPGSYTTQFSIFIDEDANQQNNPAREKRPDGRNPLSSRSDSANSSPLPSPQSPVIDRERLPENDPRLLNIENLFSEPYAMPVATLPISESNIDQPDVPITAGAGSPPPAVNLEAAIRDPRNIRATVDLAPPVDMILYWLLDISEWHASIEDIRLAYRRMALYHHPDRVSGFMRGTATERMQRINGARAVLLDRERRIAYHQDGRHPWEAR